MVSYYVKKKKGSRPWIDIIETFSLFEKFARFIVGYGKSIRLWEDAWLNQFPLKISFPNMFAISHKKEAMIADYWDNDNETWIVALRRGLFDREFQSWVALVEKLNAVNLGEKIDIITWSFDKPEITRVSQLSEILSPPLLR